MDLSGVISGVQGYGPTDEQKRRIQDSIFGSVLGLSLAAVLSLIGYLAAVAVLSYFWKVHLSDLAEANPRSFWPILLALPMLIVVYFVIPAGIKAYRERQIYALTPNPARVGYFRIQPYDETDEAQYYRPDGALERALAWIGTAESPVLYLSGSSGAGKSSLVAAGMAPALEKAGWVVLFVRRMGKPCKSLGKALQTHRRVFEKPPECSDPYDLLVRSARKLKLAPKARLLVVLDQFEEYLILDSEEEHANYAQFLKRLVAEPIEHVHLLHVFREDYRALLFEQDLPDFVPRRTGFELAPFTRTQAEAFLKGGPQMLDQRGYDALFEGLNHIEEAPGVYRPITLNIVGYVLDRQGSKLAVDPARLIETYIRNCVQSGATRDYNKRVLRRMITREGTKTQKGVTEIAEGTGLTEVQVRAALYKLACDGLVRSLGADCWEISHDFLARQLDRVLGRLPAPFLQRSALPVLGIAAVGWVCLALLGVPYWYGKQTNAALETLKDAGFSLLPCSAGTCLELVRTENANEALSILAAQDVWLDIRELDLSGQTGITSLEPLADLSLESLDLSGATGITELDPLAGMPLNRLSLRRATEITELDPLAGMSLEGLVLKDATGITELDPLAGMPLRVLVLSGVTGITSLDPLAGMKLEYLDLSGATGITELDPLAGMPLGGIVLTDATGITSLAPLEGLHPKDVGGASDALLATLGQ